MHSSDKLIDIPGVDYGALFSGDHKPSSPGGIDIPDRDENILTANQQTNDDQQKFWTTYRPVFLFLCCCIIAGTVTMAAALTYNGDNPDTAPNNTSYPKI